jgi:hypothetical protein
LPDALMSFRRAVSVDPANAYALEHVSFVLSELGHNADSIEWGRRAMTFRPDARLAYRIGLESLELDDLPVRRSR